MKFSNPLRDFYIKVGKYAREIRLRDLNLLEADLMLAEQQLMTTQKITHVPRDVAASVENRISTIKDMIKNKKNQL